MTAPGCSILVSHTDEVVWARVVGRATFQESLALEAYLKSCAQDAPPGQVQIGLSHCVYMDSTFIGTLLRLATGHVLGPGVACRVMAPSPECRELIHGMHLDDVLAIVPDATDPPGPTESLPTPPLDSKTLGRHALDAHQHLADANQDNARLFGPIVEQLREELDTDPPDADADG